MSGCVTERFQEASVRFRLVRRFREILRMPHPFIQLELDLLILEIQDSLIGRSKKGERKTYADFDPLDFVALYIGFDFIANDRVALSWALQLVGFLQLLSNRVDTHARLVCFDDSMFAQHFTLPCKSLCLWQCRFALGTIAMRMLLFLERKTWMLFVNLM